MSIENKNVVATSIETEMQTSYLDYAMSVIISRALPDCRDGLKPVHRRIIYAMYATGNQYDKPYRKSARIVGEAMGKYHPHGDSPIYGALVRMAQTFSLREVLIDGQGNFGSIDDDPPAQMRYTEARLSKLSNFALLEDIEKDTVDFQDNYDGSEREPKVLPASFPNLLVNGASGIAVGMATNIPTHNLGEVLDGCCAYLDNRDITAREMLKYIPAPDFPSGGTIYDYKKVENAMITGRGGITVCGNTVVEQISENRECIVITELPYQVNKSELIKSIEMLSKEKTIDGITDIRDESNKLGIRIVIELKRDVNSTVLLNKLYKHTPLSSSFSLNMLAIKDGEPVLMNVLQVIANFIKFREEVVIKRSIFLLEKAKKREHLLLGLILARDNIDDVIRIIRGSSDTKDATGALLAYKWHLSNCSDLVKQVFLNDVTVSNSNGPDFIYLTPEQVHAILDMKLQRLTKLENSKILEEIAELRSDIDEYIKILNNHDYLCEIIKNELLEIKRIFPSKRLTKIEHRESVDSEEDLIEKEEIVVTLTSQGYIKRTLLKSYNEQKRGGRGKTAMSIYDGDVVTNLTVATTHDNVLFFSNFGKAYALKAYKIPLCPLQSKGRAIVNILPLSENDVITNVLAVSDVKKEGYHDNQDTPVLQDDNSHREGFANDDNSEEFDDSDGKTDISIVFATRNGYVRRNSIADFQNIQSNGKIAIKLEEQDKLVGVVTCTRDNYIFLATKNGKAICFSVSALRIFKSRSSDGVRGMSLSQDDFIVSVAVLNSLAVDIQIREKYLSIPISERAEIRELHKQSPNLDLALSSKVITFSKEYAIDPKILVELAINEKFILTVTNYGFGKLTSCYEYRVTNRGGNGVTNISQLAIAKNQDCEVVASFPIELDGSIVVVTQLGILIRVSISDNIRVTGRNTAGVKIINLQSGDRVCSVKKIEVMD